MDYTEILQPIDSETLTRDGAPEQKSSLDFEGEYERIRATSMNIPRLSTITANLGTVTIGRFGDYKVVVSPGDDVQKAIDSIGTDGGTVFLTAGTYTLTDNLDIPSNLILEGEGMGVVTLYFSTVDKGIKVQGSDNYSTGTLSINNGSTALVGSGTSWDGNVTTSHKIKLQNFWYDISAVTDDTHITLSAKYLGTNLSGATYDSAVMVENFKLKDFTVYYSGGNGIYINYAYYFYIDDVVASTCGGDGMNINNSSTFAIRGGMVVDNTSDGLSLTNIDHFTIDILHAYRNGAKGINANTVVDSEYENVVARNNVDGIYLNTCADSSIYACDLSNNSSQGIEGVSTNRMSIVSTEFQNNTSDGLKLTSNCDEWRVGGSNFKDNGGYGINVVDSTDDDNNITGNIYSGNTSGKVNDAGTNTRLDTPKGVALEATVMLFQANPATGDFTANPEYINDNTTSTANAQAINQYAEVDFQKVVTIKRWRQYGNTNNNGDGVWKIQYYNLSNHAWTDWKTGISTYGTADWTSFSTETEEITDKIRLICTTVDSSAASYCRELEVIY